ncbi:MAG TPA: DNRLRE domain-containing protein [Candidatus Polarisedimenticolaceae bacterium]|nr:DNRLRE domain-containing protein [Candidatus Polarisedimenticolaceae bacterium]
MRAALAFTALLAALPAAAQTISLPADRDATLIESPEGVLANGAGPALFAGRTNQVPGGVRRALLHFTLPPLPSDGQGRGIVERAALVVQVLPGNPGPREIRAYAVVADWTEGPSISGGGVGAPAEPGDVTWLHTSYPTAFWPTNGGLFDGHVLATATVDAEGTYRLEGPGLTALVTAWFGDPSRNFGILVAGDETVRQTSKAIASREAYDPALQPILEITVRPRTVLLFPRPSASALGRR